MTLSAEAPACEFTVQLVALPGKRMLYRMTNMSGRSAELTFPDDFPMWACMKELCTLFLSDRLPLQA